MKDVAFDRDRLTELTAVGQALFFSVGAPESALWKSDGTEIGTVRLRPFTFDIFGSGLLHLRNVSGTLFFTANDGVTGRELWRSDGTSSGTLQVRDLVPGSDSSRPEKLAALGSILLLSADDRASGLELCAGRDLAVDCVQTQGTIHFILDASGYFK